MPVDRGALVHCEESTLVRLAQKGDREAFAQLVRLRQAWVRNLMRRLCGNAAVGDELAQRVFLNAWRALHQVRDPECFGGWLKRVAISAWLRHGARRGPEGHAGDAGLAEVAVPPQQGVVSVALDLDRALATLPPPARLCVVLSYHERLTHEEIARVTGIPAGTVKSHIRRATQRLRVLLSHYGPSPAEENRA